MCPALKAKIMVTQTSRAAYAAHQHIETQAARIARHIRNHATAAGLSISEISQALGMQNSTVSARLNALKKMEINIDGAAYRLTLAQVRPSRVSARQNEAWILQPITAQTPASWAL